MNSGAPMSSKIMRGLFDPRVAGRLKFAQAFPQVAGLGWLMNKIQPRIAGQRGALGQGLGPQMANLANRMSSGKIRTHEQAMKDFGPGIMGGTLGPRIRNAFGGGGGGTGIFGGTLGPRIRNTFGGGGSGGRTGLFGGTLGPTIAGWFGFGDDGDTTLSSKKK